MALKLRASGLFDPKSITDKEATCTEDGVESIHCSTCGAIKSGSERTIAATGHSWGSWYTIVEPTTSSEGIKERVCSKCGEPTQASIPVFEEPGSGTDDDEYELDAVNIVALKRGKKAITVKWTVSNDIVDGYQIQYSRNKSFKSASTVTVRDTYASSKKIGKLKAKKKYYVRVRSYLKENGSTYYSEWSFAKSIKTR